MAIKKLTFSFEVPITQLLGLIATGNTGLKIDVAGDERATKAVKALANGHAPKLLESPDAHAKRQKKRNDMPGWHLLLKAMAANPEHTKAVRDLAKMLSGAGLSEKSVSPQLSMMQKKSWMKRIDEGVYQLTAKGALQAEKLGFHVSERRLKAKKKTLRTQLSKQKRKPETTPETTLETTLEPAVEAGHG